MGPGPVLIHVLTQALVLSYCDISFLTEVVKKFLVN